MEPTDTTENWTPGAVIAALREPVVVSVAIAILWLGGSAVYGWAYGDDTALEIIRAQETDR